MAMVKIPWTGGSSHWVRISAPFEAEMRQVPVPGIRGPEVRGPYEPVEALTRMFMAIIGPAARDVFTLAYSPARLLWRNDYIIEKAFVFGVIALSKWLGDARFPQGLYGSWPPRQPTPVEAAEAPGAPAASAGN